MTAFSPAPRSADVVIEAPLPLLRTPWVVALVAVALLGCPRHSGPDSTLPLVTTDNRAAEDEVRAAREAADDGRGAEAVERYESYLARYPDDALRPVALLGLGRLRLAEGQPTVALPLFEEVARHSDAAVAERGRFYVGVTRHFLGEHEAAIALLDPLRGRTVDPEETVLLLRTLAASALATHDLERAVVTLDALLAEPLSDEDRGEAAARLTEALAGSLGAEAAQRLYQTLPHDGVAWPILARTQMRAAFAAGDLPQVRSYARALTDAGETLEPDLASMAMRAERTGTADPRVIGALLPLSGRGQEAGQAALRGMALAAGAPPTGPLNASDFQIIHRDIGDDPAAAVAAVDELVTLHRVVAIVGPIGAEAAALAAERAQALGVPLITLSPVGELEARGRNIFRILPSPAEEVRALLRATLGGATRRVAVLHAAHGYGRAIRDAASAAVSGLGGELAGAVEYAPGTTAFGDAMRALAALHPDVVVVGDGASAVTLIAPSLAAVGLVSVGPGQAPPTNRRAVRLLLPSLAFDQGLARSSGRYLQGALAARPFDASGPLSPAAQQFHDAFTTRYGQAPSMLAAYAFDAISLVQSRVEAGTVTREALADALAGHRDLSTAGASQGFNAARGPNNATNLLRFDGSAWVAAR
ncbi:MAG: ABC transporter substrate-binding protein [Polyangiales bacterium]